MIRVLKSGKDGPDFYSAKGTDGRASFKSDQHEGAGEWLRNDDNVIIFIIASIGSRLMCQGPSVVS